MKDIIIVCAGGFAKEIVTIIEQINKNKDVPEWNLLGFLDDTKSIGEEIYHGYRVLESIENYNISKDKWFALGISKPKSKEKLYNKLKEKGANFATLIRPSTLIQPETEIGEGCIIGNAWMGTDIKLGKCVSIMGSMIGASIIGDFCSTTGFVNIAAAKLGKRVFVGSHAVVLNGCKVGDDCFICAGSIVMTNLKAGSKVMGYPAKKFEL